MNRFYNFFGIRETVAGNICHSEEEFNKKLKVECSRLVWNEQEFSLLLLTLKPAESSQKKIHKFAHVWQLTILTFVGA